MTTQLEVFRLVAPQFAAKSDEDVTKFLSLAALFINPLAYAENQRGLALVLKAASLMFTQSLSSSGETGGQVLVSEREGDLERRYATSGTAATSSNIYEDQLAELGLGVSGGCIMTRYGSVVPQGIVDGYY